MNRNGTKFLVMLAVALTASLAIASAAHAAPEFSAAEFPAFVKGTHVGNVGFTETGSITCEEASYDAFLEKKSSTLTLEPKYSKCKDALGQPVTWFWNGCDYLVHLKEKTAPNNFKGNFDYACPAGKQVEAKGYTNGAHTNQWCLLTIAPQTGLLSVTYTNFEEGGQKKIEMVLKVEKIVFNQFGAFCAGKFEKGLLEGTVKLSAQDAEANPLNLEIVGE